MIPELRGAAFALVLAFTHPLTTGEGDLPTSAADTFGAGIGTLAADSTLREQPGIPLATFLTLSELEVLRTPRGARPELRNIRTEDRR